MVWLYVLLAVFAILLLILFVPINLIAEYQEELKVKIKFMGIPFSISSFGVNNAKENNDKSSVKGKKRKSSKNVWYTAKKIGTILKTAKKVIIYIAKKIEINFLKLILYVGDKDAAAVAIKYGQANAIIYPALSAVNNINPPKRVIAEVVPDFLNEKVEADFEIDVKSSVFNLLLLFVLIFREYRKIV